MYKRYFGRQHQIECSTHEEYYQLLGYLAKSDGTTALTWEHNEDQGAWGSEGRIHFYEDTIPLSCKLRLTKGTGSLAYRVNCNEFVEHIVKHHHFVEGKYQNITTIKRTIPERYIPDFESGLSL